MDAADEALFVGYYVERGLLAHQDRDKVMKEGWHWHGLLRCLTEPSPAATLNGFMLGLPSSRATVWLEGEKVEQPDGTTIPAYSHVLPYVGPTTLSDVLEIIGGIPSTQWINLMLGSRFAKAECLKRQAALLAEFKDPIFRAYDIWELVKRSVP